MSRRTTVLLIPLVAVLTLVGGCKEATSTPSPVARAATEPRLTDTATPAPSTPTEEVAVESTETPGLAEGPALLAPPDGTVGTAIDLVWAWEQELGEDEWFELQIWRDEPEAEPEIHDWYKEKQECVTSASLSPGGYLWQVLVVQGREGEGGEVIELDYVEPLHFTLVRPSLRRGEPGVTPAATDTPIPPTDTPEPPVYPGTATPANGDYPYP